MFRLTHKTLKSWKKTFSCRWVWGNLSVAHQKISAYTNYLNCVNSKLSEGLMKWVVLPGSPAQRRELCSPMDPISPSILLDCGLVHINLGPPAPSTHTVTPFRLGRHTARSHVCTAFGQDTVNRHISGEFSWQHKLNLCIYTHSHYIVVPR